MALVKAGINVDPSAKHDFINDRARSKKVKNIDELYEKLNDLEKNGVLELWAKKFGKKKYLKESIEIIEDILIEDNKIIFFLDKKSIIEEMAAAAGVGGGIASTPATGYTASSGNSPMATYGAEPSKNKKLLQKNRYAKPTLQDTNLSKVR